VLSLKHYDISGDFTDLRDKIQTISHKFFYSFKSCKVFSSIFSRSDILELKKLGSNRDIVVCKPDKGNGVVVLDKSKYLTSMHSILSDTSKFSAVTVPAAKFTRKIEDKINNTLRKLKNLKVLSDDLYKQLFVTGSSAGILYGLPKIHKPDFSSRFQCRPIFAAYNTPSFNIAKYFVPILKPLTVNEFTVDNSSKFSESIILVPNADDTFMASFDVENLFTNIPLRETIDICLRLLFTDPSALISGLNLTHFRTLLELSVLNCFFFFNEKLYQQTEGLGMGLPLGPTFANIFMCYYENIWLQDCPVNFKPLFYRRYVDDTFLLFRQEGHAKLFLEYLNQKHQNINFTMESEQDGKLPFLDTIVFRENNRFQTAVFRKPTFTGLGTSFFSYCSQLFKINSLKTLLHRAYKVSSNFSVLHIELEFLKSFFTSNGYPIRLIERHINQFLSNSIQPPPPVATVSQYSSEFYFRLPYFGHQSEKLKLELTNILAKFYPNIKFNFILTNNFKISSFFSYKDKLPKALRSSLVYNFSCAQCASVYVGSTVRTLETRVGEHAGRLILETIANNAIPLSI